MALCAGAGGLELALRIALGDDYRCVVYVEREAYAAAALVARMADQALDQAPVWDDVVTFDGEPWRGVVDIVSAGFSCQPWSSAGKQLGIEDERWIWPDVARVIRETRPEWVFLENVPELVGGGLEYVLSSLAAEGFDVEWDCVSAAEVGATHERQRLYILAHSHAAGLGGIGRFVVSDNGQASRWDDVDGRSSSSSAVGDTDGTGLAPSRQSQQRGSDERLTGSASTALADPASVQWETIERIGEDGDVVGFPPRPDDLFAWGSVPEILEPAVCRVAYGMAHRVDRLRLTGNGVVPLAAAVAFLRLRDRLTSW